MATFTWAQAAVGSGLLNLGALTNGSFIASSSIDLGANIPMDVVLLVECTPSSAPSGNKQLIVYAQFSLDNSTFTADSSVGENQLHYIASLPVNTSNTAHRKLFSMTGLPVARYLKLVAKNDTGATLTSGNIYKADITGSSA